MPRAKAVVAPRAGVARAGRASHPTRGAAANKSYFGQEEMDEEMDVDGYEEGDTTLVNPGDSGDEEEEPVNTQDELKTILSAFHKSRSKKDKAEAAKIEKQMKETLRKGQDVVDLLVADHFKCREEVVTGLQLDNNRPLSRIELKGYEGAFSEQYALTRQLVAAIDGYKKELDPTQKEFFDAAKQALHSRPQQAKRAYKKLGKGVSVVLNERQALAEHHQGAAQEAYRHFKALVNL